MNNWKSTLTQTTLEARFSQRSPDDIKPAGSVEDGIFLEILDREVYTDEASHWVTPLPFRSPRHSLLNNMDQALKRLYLSAYTSEKGRYKRTFCWFSENLWQRSSGTSTTTEARWRVLVLVHIWGVSPPETGEDLRWLKRPVWRHLLEWHTPQWTRLKQHVA